MPSSRASTSMSRLSQQDIRHDKLLSKILVRIVAEIKRKGVEPTADMMDAARHRVEAEWGSSMSERQIKSIASEVVRAEKRAMSSMAGPVASSPVAVPREEKERTHTPPPKKNIVEQSPAISDSQQVSEIRDLLKNTTRREREMMADAEWVSAAERDRVAGIEGKIQDRRDDFNRKLRQRGLFDQQLAEHKREAEAQHQRDLQAQRDMDAHIENHRYLTRKERQDAFDKEMREKKFREEQHAELERLREEARTREHNEQVRQTMIARQELEKARQDDLERLRKERSEWQRVLQDNQDRLEWKSHEKERERGEDRRFQKEYSDRLDRMERERAETYARKAARAKYFQKLADGVASQFMAKEQDLTDKIESEYQEQLQRALSDESRRKKNLKARTDDCQSYIRRQMEEHEEQKRQDRAEAKRQADLLGEQIAEAKHQEECRRMASKQEAVRLKHFLGSQLQMQHFREARPAETSITRPMSRASTMYTPSRYTPSLKPEDLVSETERKDYLEKKKSPKKKGETSF